MSFAGAIEDQVQIRALIDTYADAVFRRDATDWGATWAEDASWSLSGQTVEGREAIVTMWKQAMGQFSFVAFYTQVGAIEVDGDRATGRSYTNEVLRTAEGKLMRMAGAYEDGFVKRDGRWLFSARRFTLLTEF
jgi:uncharacterized protein (TIGR02246 family)